jgi:hypothetical protein
VFPSSPQTISCGNFSQSSILTSSTLFPVSLASLSPKNMNHFSQFQLSKSSKKQKESSSNAHTVMSHHSARFVRVHPLVLQMSLLSGMFSSANTGSALSFLPHQTSNKESNNTDDTASIFFIVFIK